MIGRIAALYRHPVKGLTPERLDSAILRAGECFPGDRLFAVEAGPSGYDPEAPRFIPKSRFAVLANTAEVARVRTAYDERTGRLAFQADGQAPQSADLGGEPGREAFAAWLQATLGEAARGRLRVVEATGAHRFTDDIEGQVSVVNLQSVRDLERRLGRPVDPLRFRANLYVEGWAPWSELDLAHGAPVRLGGAEAHVVKPIVRCAATHVDPATGARDLDLVGALKAEYGHAWCGLYLTVSRGARVAEGDAAEVAPDAGAAATAPPPAG